MEQTQLLAFCAAVLASFMWIEWTRDNARRTRVLGVVLIVGAWLVFRVLERT